MVRIVTETLPIRQFGSALRFCASVRTDRRVTIDKTRLFKLFFSVYDHDQAVVLMFMNRIV